MKLHICFVSVDIDETEWFVANVKSMFYKQELFGGLTSLGPLCNFTGDDDSMWVFGIYCEVSFDLSDIDTSFTTLGDDVVSEVQKQKVLNIATSEACKLAINRESIRPLAEYLLAKYPEERGTSSTVQEALVGAALKERYRELV